MALRPAILDRPPAEGARTVALALLAGAREQAGRIGIQGDPEALHDFRVAVRRLRLTLRAWREVLGPAVRDKDLRRLRRVARATGEARDAEVLVDWIDRSAGDLSPPEKGAAAWLRRRLEERARHPDVAGAVQRLVETCDRLERRSGARARAPRRGDSIGHWPGGSATTPAPWPGGSPASRPPPTHPPPTGRASPASGCATCSSPSATLPARGRATP